MSVLCEGRGREGNEFFFLVVDDVDDSLDELERLSEDQLDEE